MSRHVPRKWSGLSGGRCSKGYRMALASSSMRRTHTLRMFGEKIKLSRIVAVTQAHIRPRPILDLLEKPDKGTPSVNNTADREVAPKLINFWRAFPCILQEIWETDLVQGPVQFSKLVFTDAYHRGTLRPSQVDASTYVIPLAPGDKGCITQPWMQ